MPAALAASLAAGCGYRFTPQGGELPEGVRTLYVPVFRNLTAEPGVEGYFTSAFRRELARAGREGGEGSDAIAYGTVEEITEGSPIYANSPAVPGEGPPPLPEPASMRVRAKASVRLERGGKTIAQVAVVGNEDYRPGGEVPVLHDEASRRMALRRLADALMRQALERLSSGF